MVEVAPGAKVTVTWVAVDTNGVAPANYKIDEVDIPVPDAAQNQIYSSISKPTSDWPVGLYEVDIAVDGKFVSKTDFRSSRAELQPVNEDS